MSDAFGTNSVRQAALLIDADNFADPQAIEAAYAEFNAYAGRVSVCRAYGAGPRLEWLQRSVWRYLGTRTFPNLPLEKNTTDSALIADAVALHFQQGIRLFAIASGDADFAPLAVRLREWGCEVWCFSMEGIVFRDAETYYDRVVQFCPPQPQPQPPSPSPSPVTPVVDVKLPVKSAAPRAPEETPTMPVFNGAPGAEKFSNPPPASPKPAAKPAPNPDLLLPDGVLLILKALPGLREGPQHLSQAAAKLRQQGILGKTVKSTQFLAPYAAYFKLSPPHQPNRLEFLAPPSKMVALSAVSGARPSITAPIKEDAQTLNRILAAFPGWLPDTVRQLSLMTILLQESGIQTGGKPLPELFASWPEHFKLLPVGDQPQKVRLLKKPEALEFAC